MIFRIPLVPKSAHDPLSVALPPVVGVTGFYLCLAVDHPVLRSAYPWLLALTLAWAGLRLALKFEPSLLSGPVLALLGAAGGAGVAATIAGFCAETHGPVPPGFRPMMSLLGAEVFLVVGMYVDLWRNENWVSRETALRRCAWGTLLLAAGLIALSIAAPLATP